MLYDVKVPGRYEIRAVIAGQQAGVGNIQASLVVQDAGDPMLSQSRGANAIKQKLVELHSKLLGKTYARTSPEIQASYKLFVDTWKDKVALNAGGSLTSPQSCEWALDQNFLEGLNYPGDPLKLSAQGNRYDWDWASVGKFMEPMVTDPLYVKQSWVVVMSYLLSHYDFIYE
jgi:hypothetical protein